jgi:capsular polysaccharide biosynthesis protein
MLTEQIQPPVTVKRPPPVNLKPGDENLFQHEYVREIGPALVRELRDVEALPNGFLIAGGRLVREALVGAPRGIRALKAQARMLQYRLLARQTTIARGVWVTDEFSNGYFHWICDVLPRLEAVGMDAVRGRTLLVPAMADYSYCAHSLEAFKLENTRCFPWSERVRAGELLVVGPAAPTGNFRPSHMIALRERMRRRFGAGAPGRKLYISRARAPGRRIANEEEVGAVFLRHGYERIAPEELSFDEQVRIAGSASVLAGNHGAGLTNMCWMVPGTTVLELRRQGDRHNNCYYSLAAALGIGYRYLACSAADERQPTHVADLVVDLHRLETELAMIG